MRRVLIATTSQCLRRKKLLGKEESKCGKIWTKRELSPGAIKRLWALYSGRRLKVFCKTGFMGKWDEK